ncbi:hypothetical protein MMC32_000426 [Xylographa parallela]|nr:hypothetical protein [Xylographa parallela]
MPAPTTSEADIIFNRANVALAKSQRLIASWLPPRTEEELRNVKSAEEIEREEQETFAPVPELLGLGAPLPQEIKNGDERRQELSSNDKLRKQLLGKEFAKLYGRTGPAAKKDLGNLPLGSKPRPIPTTLPVDEDVEEDGGRSSLGKPKRKIGASLLVIEQDEGAVDNNEPLPRSKTGGKGSASSSKRGSTYLDEVLAEKLRKKTKKKRGSVSLQQKLVDE